MSYDWYKIFSLTEFLATELVSKTYTVVLEGIGKTDILVTNGNVVGITYEDTFLPLQFADKNPYARSTYAIFRDTNDYVWLGIEVAE